MKFYTSYFYKIRFFKPYQIPFSTAMWNPHFFQYEHIDANGVLNGLRANPLVPGPICKNDCKGPEKCMSRPQSCLFLKHYRMQLDRLKFNEIIQKFEDIAAKVKNDLGFEEEPEIILIVYEAPNNPCSERRVIQEWFRDNGVECKELE